MLWNRIRDGHEAEDMPQIAGYEVLVSIQNRCGQIFVTEAFIGYFDWKWYTSNKEYMQDARKGDNRLHEAWKVLAWMDKPEPYNPYLIDGRSVIKEMRRRIKTPRSTMEINRDAIPMIEKRMERKDDWTV